MSNSGFRLTGRPSSESDEIKNEITEYPETLRIFRFCGAIGGGGCVVPIGTQYVIWGFRVPKYVTYNRKVVFHNPENAGVRIYTDAGSDILCPNSLGDEVSFWMGLAATNDQDPQAVALAGKELNGALPYDIEFTEDQIPQPTDAGWENIIYAYIYWGNSSYVSEGSAFKTMETPRMFLTKHDRDVNQ